MVGLKRLFNSRAFWSGILGLIGVVLVQSFGQDEARVKAITEAIMAFVLVIIGKQAVEDYAEKRDAPKK